MCASVVERSITPRCRRGGFGLRGFESLPTHKTKIPAFGRFFRLKVGKHNALTSKHIGGLMPEASSRFQLTPAGEKHDSSSEPRVQQGGYGR